MRAALPIARLWLAALSALLACTLSLASNEKRP